MCLERPVADDGLVRMQIGGHQGAIAQAIRRLDGAGVAIDDIAVRRPTLDDVFIALTGHAAEPDSEDGEREVVATEERPG
jgi:ABC-2 type transport system ATP-binding protein